MKTAIIIFMLVVEMMAAEKHTVGGVENVDPEKFKEITKKLENNLHLLKGENLKIVKIDTIKEQVVAGKLYTINGTFEDHEKVQFLCEITIWERPWLEEAERLQLTMKTKTALVGHADVGNSALNGQGHTEDRRNHFVLLLAAYIVFALV